MLTCYVVEPEFEKKGIDFAKLGLKVMLWTRFGEAWRSLGGVREGSWRRFWGSWEVLGGLLISRCRFVKKCKVFDPKLGSMLGQKNVFFGVKNWKNRVPRGVTKKVRFWSDFLVKNYNFLKVREMQKCGFRLGGVHFFFFFAKIVCRCWGFKNRAPEGGFGRLFGVENGVQTRKMRFERPTEK